MTNPFDGYVRITLTHVSYEWFYGDVSIIDANGNGYDDNGEHDKANPPRPPSITSNGGGPTAAIILAENTTAVTTVQASDPDAGARLTYSITGGADAAQFRIDALTGALVFVTAPNFEARGDAGADNVYNVTVRVSDGLLSDDQALAVRIVNANEAPVITSNGGGETATVAVDENARRVGFVTASDVDGRTTFTYSIVGGADAAKFSIDSRTGFLTFIAAPNFEAPSDVGANNVYDVIVRASDGALSDDQALAITVANVNEAPALTSNGGLGSAWIVVNENLRTVTTVRARDADAGSTLAYSIAGGADRAKFIIDPNSGVLSFVAAPDFEARGASDSDNTYNVTVRVTDNGGLIDDQAITVEVRNVNERPSIVSNGGYSSAAITVAENTVAVTNVGAIDPDRPTLFAFSIVGGVDASRFAINTVTGALSFIAPPNFEAPGDLGRDNVYNVTVRVSDGSLADDQAIAVTVRNVNEFAPFITSNGGGATAALTMAENTQAVTFVSAADGDAGASLRFGIVGGADAGKFAINSVTGALVFRAAPDFETPGDVGADNVYDVVVRVSDGLRIDDQAIAITVTDALDTYTGTAEADTFVAPVGRTNWTILGLGGDDQLTSSYGNDRIFGGSGKDTMLGGTGSDTLDGGVDADVLTGGSGRDRFIFSSLGVSADQDTITDFISREDQIILDKAAFGAFAADAVGALLPNAFVVGTAALTADQHLIYDSAKGELFYDADGSGAGSAVLIALLTGRPMLEAGDFALI